MEQAKKDVTVKLSDGREVKLIDLTAETLLMVPKDGKPATKGGTDFTSITAKKALVNESDDIWIERRVLQNSDWPSPAMFDLELPKTWKALEALISQGKTTKEDVLDNYVSSARVKADHAHSTVPSTSGRKPVDPLAKAIDAGIKSGQLTQSQLDQITAIMTNAGIKGSPVEVIEKAKVDLKKRGFAK